MVATTFHSAADFEGLVRTIISSIFPPGYGYGILCCVRNNDINIMFSKKEYTGLIQIYFAHSDKRRLSNSVKHDILMNNEGIMINLLCSTKSGVKAFSKATKWTDLEMELRKLANGNAMSNTLEQFESMINL